MKSLQEFVALFAEQFDESDAALFTPETRFRDLDEWSSILGLSIIAMVDEEFEVALRANDFRKAETIADLYKVVLDKLG